MVLIGVVLVLVGFAFRINPLVVVTVAALATGTAGGSSLHDVIATFGRAFADSRYVAIPWLVLPVIGTLEREGLKERARNLVARMKGATPGRVLMAYLAVRQVSAALGLLALGGHAGMVRPLIAPMAEGAAENRGAPDDRARFLIRAHAAAVDNIGAFFGEDIFIAIGSILLIKAFLEQNHIVVDPLSLAVWAIPTAVVAFVVHVVRLAVFDRRIARAGGPAPERAGR